MNECMNEWCCTFEMFIFSYLVALRLILAGMFVMHF